MRHFIYILIVVPLLLSCSGFNHARPDAISTGKIPLITVVFDDGYETDYTVARDVFKAHGDVACTAIVTGWVNTPDYLTVPQLHKLKEDGWEIMAHTVTHPNLRDLSEGEIEAELSRSKAMLLDWGLPVKSMVYPYNKSNDIVKKVAAKHYRAGRAGQRMFNTENQDPYDLKSFSCERSFRHQMSEIKSYIDRAYAEKKWLILYQHQADARIKIFDKSGSYKKDEQLRFKPSGASGKYIKDNWLGMEFIPLSGTPLEGDVVTGESSGAISKIESIDYNEREALNEMLDYIHKNYPDMQIVTIDKGLDIMGIP